MTVNDFLERIIICIAGLALCQIPSMAQDSSTINGYKLVWADEFEYSGSPDSLIWNFEEGFVRNHEFQWYCKENAIVRDGLLTIEACKVSKKNPWYLPNSDDWRRNRESIDFTSSCLTTKGKKSIACGRVCVRARIPVGEGAWPAIWMLGEDMEWPSCGEIDIMEFYRVDGKPTILANAAWGNDKRFNAEWNTRRLPFSHFLEEDPFWFEKFHIWRMDWDESAIKIYLDDELLNEIDLTTTFNGTLGQNRSPFHQPHYFLINLAIGGDNGGEPDPDCFPMKYEIDYVRVYEREK